VFRVVIALVAGVILLAPSVALAGPERSTSDRLQDRRYVAAGDRAQIEGMENGRFNANGWHITGEMGGGVWTPPLKLVDGVWFGIDDQWIGEATKFTSGWGYTRMDFPDASGLQVSRTDFAPDHRRAGLFGLTLTNPGAAKTVKLTVDSHSELMSDYPWGFSTTPNAADNVPDTASYDGESIVFRDQGSVGGVAHDYAALVGASQTPDSGTTGDNFRGPQSAGNVCKADEPPSACDDGPFGKGKGGELTYTITVPANDKKTFWLAVAGSDEGLSTAQNELAAALDDPAGAFAAKKAKRDKLGSYSKLTMPGDQQLADGVDWGKQNLADLTQTARKLKIRWTDQGKQYPPPLGTVPKVRWIGAGFPDYPWMFATDGEYTAFAAVATGQFKSIEDHMRGLRDVSDILNDRSGVVVHETVSDGSVWFGHDSRHLNADGTTAYDFNTDETVKFPSTVALIWRWTGDNRFRDEMYDFAKRNLHYVDQHLDDDHDGWPEGSGNVERPKMGPEKLDNTVYFIRGLYDLADMAQSKGDGATERWALRKADGLRNRFEGTWWIPSMRLYADSLSATNEQIEYKHWITVTPAEAELTVDRRAVPGLAPFDHGDQTLGLHETDCFSGDRPLNRGLFHTACEGGDDGKGDATIFSLNTAIQGVGEGNYGRLGTDQQRRYTDADTEPMFGEPAANGEPDEQPGALPEILPSPAFGKNIDRCWTCRSMFMQAWGQYGTAWPAVHQQLGVRPDLGRGDLTVVPQLPSSSPIAGENIRLGRGALDLVRATRAGNSYATTVHSGSAPLHALAIGATLPRGSKVAKVTLDGKKVGWQQRTTNRGLEVTTKAKPGRHTVVVTAR
jgi:hypothetical protein